MADPLGENKALKNILTEILSETVSDEDLDFDFQLRDLYSHHARWDEWRPRTPRFRPPYILLQIVRNAGPPGRRMWRNFRSLRSSLKQFSEAGVKDFPSWSFSDGNSIPVDPDNKLLNSYTSAGDAEKRSAPSPASFIKAWERYRHSLKEHYASDKRHGGPSTIPIPEAESKFASLLSGSLTAAQTLGRVRSGLFEVYNASPGYRIHWTHQYWMSPTVFGSPSSPVKGKLSGGYYRFGGDIRGGPLIWDRGIFQVSSHSKRADLVDF